VAQKKCPKCGEDNPAEAVMCWACYTSLSGGPAAAAIPGRPPVGKPGPPGPSGGAEDEGGQKKGIDPKMIGIGAGVLLLLAGGGYMMFGRGGGSSDDSDDSSGDSSSSSSNTKPASNPQPAQSQSSTPGSSTAVMPGTVTAITLPAVAPQAYTVVVSPNPSVSAATIAVVPTSATITPVEAAGLARYAKNQLQHSGKWASMQVYVISDPGAARQFANYQAKKNGSPLATNDYSSLIGVWANTPAECDVNGKVEQINYPAQYPESWWTRRGQ